MIIPSVSQLDSSICHTYYHTGYEQGKADADKWISVKDRLPDNDNKVLITYIVNDNRKKRYIELAEYYCGEWLSVSDEYLLPNNRLTILAWKPLPKPYTGE